MDGKSRVFELKLSKSKHANALEVYSWPWMYDFLCPKRDVF